MPLVECPDCHRKISDSAPACPHCGKPMSPRVESFDPQATPKVQTEQTGKKFKAWQLIGTLLCVIGMVVGMFGAADSTGDFGYGCSVGLFLIVLGFLLFIASRLAAWWQHG